jgi:hypothetical protein
MSATTDAVTARLLAAHIRATMTTDESRYASDERYNVYVALDLEDADVLFALSSGSVVLLIAFPSGCPPPVKRQRCTRS